MAVLMLQCWSHQQIFLPAHFTLQSGDFQWCRSLRVHMQRLITHLDRLGDGLHLLLTVLDRDLSLQTLECPLFSWEALEEKSLGLGIEDFYSKHKLGGALLVC